METKGLAVFDIDKTLSREFLIVPIIRAEEGEGLLSSGTFNEVRRLLAALKNGDIEYEDAAHQVLVAHAAGLQGRRIDELHEHARVFLQQHTELFRHFGSQVMRLLQPTHRLIAVTAEPAYMASAVAETLKMDGVLSSEYATHKGRFTSEITCSLAHRTEKRRLIGDLRPDFAFGDSAGDIEMLAHAYHAFCISPDTALTAEARANNWKIFNGDSDADQLCITLKKCLAPKA